MTAPRPYDDIRIIDLACELGSYATRLFADLGADVIRVELPEGRGDRVNPPAGPRGGIPFEFLNVNKKSVVLDYRQSAGCGILHDLIRSADIVVYEPDDGRGDLLPLIAEVPGARILTIVSYFGLSGPYAKYKGCDLVAQAAGGIAWLSGDPDGAPLRIAGEQSWFITSLYTASATAMALWDKEHTGTGHVIDVAAQECIAHSLQNTLEAYNLEHRITRRGGEGTRDATESIFACKDGYVFLAAPLQLTSAWQFLLQWIAEEEHPGASRLREAEWQNARRRATRELRREFKQIFESFIAEKTKAELTEEALRRKILLSPVSTIADTLADPQLLHRSFFGKVWHPALNREMVLPGAPFQFSEPIWKLGRAAPALGQDDDAVLGALAKTGAKRGGAG